MNLNPKPFDFSFDSCWLVEFLKLLLVLPSSSLFDFFTCWTLRQRYRGNFCLDLIQQVHHSFEVLEFLWFIWHHHYYPQHHFLLFCFLWKTTVSISWRTSSMKIVSMVPIIQAFSSLLLAPHLFHLQNLLIGLLSKMPFLFENLRASPIPLGLYDQLQN
jgi:hypothetical protein